jgi:hypothetical protein
MSISEPLREIVDKMDFIPFDPLTDFKLRRKIKDLSDRNARIEETQECWETCNCKKK